MRKNAWVICCCTAVLSAFGIFFRWLQDQACFEAETGLAVHGSIWPYVVALMIAVAAAVLAVVCFRIKNQPHTSFPDSLPAAFAASKRARAVGGVLLGVMLALGGLWLLLSSGALSEPGLQRVLAVLAVVTGVVFARQMLAPGERENDAGALVCASMPMVLLVFWLIVSYKVNIIKPTISAYAVEILALCARSILAEAETTSARQVILQAAETLRKNYQQELCLADLLAEAHMSKSYFLRLFRRYMGTTPYNYLVNFHITQAKELLVLTDHSVGEIAQKVGFGDASNFSTRFAKATG